MFVITYNLFCNFAILKTYCMNNFETLKEQEKEYREKIKQVKEQLKNKDKMPQEFKDKNLKYYNEEVDINE